MEGEGADGRKEIIRGITPIEFEEGVRWKRGVEGEGGGGEHGGTYGRIMVICSN